MEESEYLDTTNTCVFLAIITRIVLRRYAVFEYITFMI